MKSKALQFEDELKKIMQKVQSIKGESDILYENMKVCEAWSQNNAYYAHSINVDSKEVLQELEGLQKLFQAALDEKEENTRIDAKVNPHNWMD